MRFLLIGGQWGAGEHKNGNSGEFRVISNPFEHFKAIFPRHFDVEQDEPWPGEIALQAALQQGDRRLAILHPNALMFEGSFLAGTLEEQGISVVVLREKNHRWYDNIEAEKINQTGF